MTSEECRKAMKALEDANEAIVNHSNEHKCDFKDHCETSIRLSKEWLKVCEMYDQFADEALEHRFLLHLVDVVWGEAHEDKSVPSTDWAERMIQKAKDTFC